jgi:molecular chaperone Hsp33
MGDGLKSDMAVRAMTDDGSLRVIVLHATELVRSAVALQAASGREAKLFGELLIGATLFRETMSPNHRVQLLVHSQGKPRLVADSLPTGKTRGLVQGGDDRAIAFKESTYLEVIRTLHNGTLQRSITGIAHEGEISRGLMSHLQDSEQVVSMIQVGYESEAKASIAGGFIVQLLPDPEEGILAVMTERLADFPSITELLRTHHGEVKPILDELLYLMPYTVLDEPHLAFGCNCSFARVVGALATIGKEAIKELISEGVPVATSCDYCMKEYRVGIEQLRTLLDVN